jgi:inorganic pyrophosphatase
VSLATRQNRLNLPLGERAPDEINVIVEIPSGSRNKYEYDKSLDIFRLDRALHSPIFYPGDYGFVPRTLATSTTGWDDAATARRVITESAQRFDGTA